MSTFTVTKDVNGTNPTVFKGKSLDAMFSINLPSDARKLRTVNGKSGYTALTDEQKEQRKNSRKAWTARYIFTEKLKATATFEQGVILSYRSADDNLYYVLSKSPDGMIWAVLTDESQMNNAVFMTSVDEIVNFTELHSDMMPINILLDKEIVTEPTIEQIAFPAVIQTFKSQSHVYAVKEREETTEENDSTEHGEISPDTTQELDVIE